MKKTAVVGIVLMSWLSAGLLAQKVVKQAVPTGGTVRNYYLFVPEATPAEPMPMVVLLHGSGQDGQSLIRPWQDLAKKQRIALVAPDSIDRSGWNLIPDGPDFLYRVIEEVKGKARIDPRRVYLFGHSAGGHHGLALGLLESEYFAAVAVHAGILSEITLSYASDARRKIPFALWQGANDAMVPAVQARMTQGALANRGFPAELNELKGHTHDYYGRSNEINAAVWMFFQKHRLESDPVFRPIQFNK